MCACVFLLLAFKLLLLATQFLFIVHNSRPSQVNSSRLSGSKAFCVPPIFTFVFDVCLLFFLRRELYFSRVKKGTPQQCILSDFSFLLFLFVCKWKIGREFLRQSHNPLNQLTRPNKLHQSIVFFLFLPRSFHGQFADIDHSHHSIRILALRNRYPLGFHRKLIFEIGVLKKKNVEWRFFFFFFKVSTDGFKKKGGILSYFCVFEDDSLQIDDDDLAPKCLR